MSVLTGCNPAHWISSDSHYRQVFCFGVGLVGTQNDTVTVEAAPVCLLDAVSNFLTAERLRLRAEREENVASAAADDLAAAQTQSLPPGDVPSARLTSAGLVARQHRSLLPTESLLADCHPLATRIGSVHTNLCACIALRFDSVGTHRSLVSG